MVLFFYTSSRAGPGRSNSTCGHRTRPGDRTVRAGGDRVRKRERTMRVISSGLRLLLASLGMFAAASLARAQTSAPGEAGAALALPAVPDGKETDLKFYAADGSIATGREALEQMTHANLVLWVAGNQFFAMDDVVGA